MKIFVHVVLACHFKFKIARQMDVLKRTASHPLNVSKHKIAVIGGGLAGLGCSFFISELYGGKVELCLYDSTTVGSGGASSVAAGLFHPFSPQMKIIWKGLEGYSMSSRIMDMLEDKSFILRSHHIIRPCQTVSHKKLFQDAVLNYPQLVQWLSPSEYLDIVTTGAQAECGIKKGTTMDVLGGIKIKQSKIVHVPTYLKELWKYISENEMLDAKWITSSIEEKDIKYLSERHDTVFMTCGAGISSLWPTECNKSFPLPLKLVRGQSLVYPQIPERIRPKYDISTTPGDSGVTAEFACSIPLRHALLCGEYVVPTLGEELICGATHEYGDGSFESLNAPPTSTSSSSSCGDRHLMELIEKVQHIYPILKDLSPVRTLAGIRVNSQRSHLGKTPLLGRHPIYRNVWIMTALGARGLVYHAYLAELLVRASLMNDESIIPKEIRLWHSNTITTDEAVLNT